MAGTPTGGKKAAKTNRERFGDDYYSKIGTKGGKAPTGGFMVVPDLAKKLVQ